jgi:hypothetical protein
MRAKAFLDRLQEKTTMPSQNEGQNNASLSFFGLWKKLLFKGIP